MGFKAAQPACLQLPCSQLVALGAGINQVLLNGQPLDITSFNMHALLDQLSSEVRCPAGLHSST